MNVKESFTGRDVKAVGNCKGEGDAMIALVANATGLSENQVLNMDARDVRKIGEIAKPFLSGGEG
ncbi:MAG: phage tail assembly protein [Alphaproteobacteria bacterium]|nr:phage tail assembly protein [Alphaproteobacteria bacterium]